MKIKLFEDKFSQNKVEGLIIEGLSHYAISRNRLEFGDANGRRPDAIARIDIKKIQNFELQIDFKMIDDHGNDSYWMGIKARSTDNQLTDGYLVYVRSNGNLAIYTAGRDLANAQFQIRPILNRKVSLKFKVVDSTFTVWIDGIKLSYTDNDAKVLREGFIYLYSNYTKNNIYTIKVWNIVNIFSILKNKIVLSILFLGLLALIISIIYHFFPDAITNILKDPRYQLWSGVKP